MARNYREERRERKRREKFSAYLETFYFRFCWYNVNPFFYASSFLTRHMIYYIYIEICIFYHNVDLFWLWFVRFFVTLMYVNYAIGHYKAKASFLVYPIFFFAIMTFISAGVLIPHMLSFILPDYFPSSDFISKACPFGFLDAVMITVFCRAFWLAIYEYRSFLMSRHIWEEFVPREITIYQAIEANNNK